ncbi:MAG: hypothetical protein RIE73_33320 [Coleofasciculus sp. C1-SOL-03]|uniref:hypothetical protein n=1 Tax=Coleofasciculus sp. C1-SOL-03 TaxID=3069522 RepID=UPI0033003F5D
MPDVKLLSPKQLTLSIQLDLQKIQPYCGTPIAAVYADSLLRTLRTIRDQFPFEPLTEILMAFYDAIAFENRWIDYQANQYKEVGDLLTTLVNSQLSNEEVEQTILSLEDLGFDTLPFGVEFNSSIELDKDEN